MWSPAPLPPRPPALDRVSEVLDPVLVPLGFAPGQGGASETSGQVIFCRGDVEGFDDGCVDLVVDLEATAGWRIVDVRYWGFTSDRWHLDFGAGAELADQLAHLVRTLPTTLPTTLP